MAAYATGLGMRSLGGAPVHINGVLEHLRRGPAILVGNWPNGGAHVVVISAVCIGPTAATSMVRVNNPTPVGRGIGRIERSGARAAIPCAIPWAIPWAPATGPLIRAAAKPTAPASSRLPEQSPAPPPEKHPSYCPA